MLVLMWGDQGEEEGLSLLEFSPGQTPCFPELMSDMTLVPCGCTDTMVHVGSSSSTTKGGLRGDAAWRQACTFWAALGAEVTEGSGGHWVWAMVCKDWLAPRRCLPSAQPHVHLRGRLHLAGPAFHMASARPRRDCPHLAVTELQLLDMRSLLLVLSPFTQEKISPEQPCG